jgi:hypothetical protein
VGPGLCDEDVTSHVVSAHGEGSSRYDRVKQYDSSYPTLQVLEPLYTFRGAYIISYWLSN